MIEQLAPLLQQQFSTYPELQPTDLLKLLFQRNFGCGHLVPNENDVLARLKQEWAAVTPDDTQPLTEPLGRGFARLHLASAKAQGISPQLIARLFYLSAQAPTEDTTTMDAELTLAVRLCEAGSLPLSAQQLRAELKIWNDQGRAPFSHSAAYHAAYHPAYRVVRAAYAAVLPLLVQIDNIASKSRAVVAIDGRCGAGKTTLAALLAPVFDAQQLHMDDFFLPPALRSEARLAAPGGNLHYERFAEEVLPGLQQARTFTYRQFSCRMMDYSGSSTIDGSQNIIVEGSYAMRPEFRVAYDLAIFCDVGPAMQKQRILERNGPEWYRDFETRWIPMEERYFDAMQVREACDVVLDMETVAL